MLDQALRQPAAVDHDVLSGHIGRGIGRKEDGCPDQVGRPAPTAEHGVTLPSLMCGWIVMTGRGHRRCDIAGHQVVDPDTCRSEVIGEGAGELVQPSLGSGVGGVVRKTAKGAETGNIDDRTVSRYPHRGHYGANAQIGSA